MWLAGRSPAVHLNAVGRAEAARLRERLQSTGVKPGQPVALTFHPALEFGCAVHEEPIQERAAVQGGRVGVPDDIVQTPAGDELTSGVEVEYLNDPSGEQPLPEQVTLRYHVPDDPNFQIVAWPALAIGPVLGDDEVTDQQDVEVPGAREALRIEYRLHFDQLDEPARLVALGAIIETSDGPVVADLRYVAVESEFSSAAMLDMAAASTAAMKSPASPIGSFSHPSARPNASARSSMASVRSGVMLAMAFISDTCAVR